MNAVITANVGIKIGATTNLRINVNVFIVIYVFLYINTS